MFILTKYEYVRIIMNQTYNKSKQKDISLPNETSNWECWRHYKNSGIPIYRRSG